LNNQDPKYDFIKNKTCPYCQSKIKIGADFIVCSHCGTPHHKECWDENLGCTTYGCIKNPLIEEKVEVLSENVGDLTPDTIRDSLRTVTTEDIIVCPNCKSGIEQGSDYCKFCEFNIKENKFTETNSNTKDAKEEFEKEFKQRYKNKIGITRKRFYLTLGSIFFLIAALSLLFYLNVTRLNEYFSSNEYKIKSTVDNWRDAWEDKDIEKFKSHMTEDYEYFGKDGKKVELEDRLKRIEGTFKNYKDIKISFLDFKMLSDSSTSDNDKKVQFIQNYESDKFQEKGIKTLRLYKGTDTNNEWKIYREFFD